MATKVTGEEYVKLDGQLFELKRQIRQPNGYPYDLALLIKGLQALIDGKFRHLMPPTINLRGFPTVVSSYTTHEHNHRDNFVWDPKKVRLQLTKGSPIGSKIAGDVHHEVKRLNPFNANLLDFFLDEENLLLVPRHWFHKRIFFWGTIYADENGRQMVRCADFRPNAVTECHMKYLSSSWVDDGYSTLDLREAA